MILIISYNYFDLSQVHCKDPLQIPSFEEFECNVQKKSYNYKNTNLRFNDIIECSPDPGIGVDGVKNSLFSICGSIHKVFEEIDMENLDIKCSKNICNIVAREPEKFEPNISKLICQWPAKKFNVDPKITKLKAYRKY